MKIVFVCTGNTCRSPMAEGFLKRGIDSGALGNSVQVCSAGIAASNGLSASENAVSAMKNYGIDISTHKSRKLDQKLVEEADLILTMTRAHKDIIDDFFGDNSKRIFVLREYAQGLKGDVSDPFGAGVHVYERTAQELNELVSKLIEKMKSEGMA